MVTKNVFFSTIDNWHDELLKSLMLIDNENYTKIQIAEQAIITIDLTIRKLKKWVQDYNFSSIAEEVLFFKTKKPLFISEYLFYYQILNIESAKPNSSKKNCKKFLENEISKLHHFHTENENFLNYYKRNATYLDQKYFARNAYDLKMHLPYNLYNMDEGFTTSHDQFISAYLASNRVLQYLNKEIQHLNNQNTPTIHAIQWNASKTALVELIYALHQSKALYANNNELLPIIKSFESLFNTDLQNFHKILVEIKRRKKVRAKFLQQLHDNLNQVFIETDR